MKYFLPILFLCSAFAAAEESFSIFKLGEFKYSNQKIAVIPFECNETRLCDEIRDVLTELMFSQFDVNYIEERKVRKALKQARLKKFEPENMPAMANHLQAGIFAQIKLEIEKIASVKSEDDDGGTASSLLTVELYLFNPQTGEQMLKVQSIGKGGLKSVRSRFEQLFQLAFDTDR